MYKRQFIHLIYSLPYVPTDQVVAVYEEVIMETLGMLKNSNHPDIVSNVTNIDRWVAYFEGTWIGNREENGSRISGLFPLQKWTQYEAAVEMWPRTNNSSEGDYVFYSF